MIDEEGPTRLRFGRRERSGSESWSSSSDALLDVGDTATAWWRWQTRFGHTHTGVVVAGQNGSGEERMRLRGAQRPNPILSSSSSSSGFCPLATPPPSNTDFGDDVSRRGCQPSPPPPPPPASQGHSLSSCLSWRSLSTGLTPIPFSFVPACLIPPATGATPLLPSPLRGKRCVVTISPSSSAPAPSFPFLFLAPPRRSPPSLRSP